MTYFLHTSRTAFKQSSDMLTRLIVMSFNSGLPTTIFASLCAILEITASETFFYMLFFLVGTCSHIYLYSHLTQLRRMSAYVLIYAVSLRTRKLIFPPLSLRCFTAYQP